MNPEEFVNTIYLGDRACKAIIIDSWGEKVKIQVNVISRIRSDSDTWNFYNDENIVDGFIVFTGLQSILLEPQGYIPNGEIEFLSVNLLEGIESGNRNKYFFHLVSGSYDSEGECVAVNIKIVATGIHLEDPKQPDIEITQ